MSPCWNDIIPGETSYDEAKTSIEDDWRYSDLQEAEPQENSAVRVFGFAPDGSQICCQVFSRDGQVVTSMLIQIAPDIALGPVVDEFGEPLYVGGDSPAGDQAYMALVYRDVPMVVYVFVAGAQNGRLSVTSEIIGAMYMSTSEMDLLLSCSRLYAWGGFIGYSDYMDENFDFVGAEVDNAELCGGE